MPHYRVSATVESIYILDVEAPSATDAATQVGDAIRAKTLTPTTGPNIASITASQLPEPQQP